MRGVNLMVFAFLALSALAGCRDDGGETMTRPAPAPRPEGLGIEEAVNDAALVFEGAIRSVDDADVAVVEVGEILKGSTSDRYVNVSLAPVTRLGSPGDTGVFIVDGSEPHRLLPITGYHVSVRSAKRALAGLSATDRQPGDEELRSLIATADVIVYGVATPEVGSSGRRAVVDVKKVVKGDAPNTLVISNSGQPDGPGGPWTFDAPMAVPGAFFLRQQGEAYEVISPMPPGAIDPSFVDFALEHP